MRKMRRLFKLVFFVVISSLVFYALSSIIFQYQPGFGRVLPDLDWNIPGLSPVSEPSSPVELIPEEEREIPDLVLLGARQEVLNETRYDASYVSMDYPGGDVPPDQGACTDVVIRAFRYAGIDLQKRVHEDMRGNFDLYPSRWDLDEPDPNIDHRRVPNQMRYFERHGESLTMEVEGRLDEWQWGDIVYWRFPSGQLHTGVISDRVNSEGIPLVIHNASVAREEDCLQRWEIIGHFRYPP